MKEQKENKWKQKNHNMVGKHETENLQYKILKNRLREKEKRNRGNTQESRGKHGFSSKSWAQTEAETPPI